MFEDYTNRFTPRGHFVQPDPFHHLPYAFVLKDEYEIEQMDEVYAWCVEHFGQTGPKQPWNIYKDIVYLIGHERVVEFKLRWF
ncbi:MAG: hypothetical protein EOP83_08590 [Verrucomicrobiaceae bacterium]|nr:MAG: hypothetical protein EOP83_08590 [Verrucomicrobiaceae bacterium]